MLKEKPNHPNTLTHTHPTKPITQRDPLLLAHNRSNTHHPNTHRPEDTATVEGHAVLQLRGGAGDDTESPDPPSAVDPEQLERLIQAAVAKALAKRAPTPNAATTTVAHFAQHTKHPQHHTPQNTTPTPDTITRNPSPFTYMSHNLVS